MAEEFPEPFLRFFLLVDEEEDSPNEDLGEFELEDEGEEEYWAWKDFFDAVEPRLERERKRLLIQYRSLFANLNQIKEAGTLNN